MNSGDRWGPIWHTSDAALAQADGSWITEGTRARQAKGKTEPQCMVWGEKKRVSIALYACVWTRVHIRGSLFFLFVRKRKSIARHIWWILLFWRNFSRQICCHMTLLRSDNSNNRQPAGNILSVEERARNQRAVGSNPCLAGKQLDDKVEVKSSPFQQLPSHYHRLLSDALTSQLLKPPHSRIPVKTVVLNIYIFSCCCCIQWWKVTWSKFIYVLYTLVHFWSTCTFIWCHFRVLLQNIS